MPTTPPIHPDQRPGDPWRALDELRAELDATRSSLQKKINGLEEELREKRLEIARERRRRRLFALDAVRYEAELLGMRYVLERLCPLPAGVESTALPVQRVELSGGYAAEEGNE